MSEANILTCLRQDLELAWAAETAVDPDAWTSERPSTGQCAVTALIVNALFDGKILRFDLGVHGTHYGNLIELDGEIEYVDLTDDQFDFSWKHNSSEERSREELCSDASTFARFRVLSSRLSALWASEHTKNLDDKEL